MDLVTGKSTGPHGLGKRAKLGSGIKFHNPVIQCAFQSPEFTAKAQGKTVLEFIDMHGHIILFNATGSKLVHKILNGICTLLDMRFIIGSVNSSLAV